jgi:hypothetical protein
MSDIARIIASRPKLAPRRSGIKNPAMNPPTHNEPTASPAAPSAPPPATRRGGGFRRALLTLVVLAVLVAVGWTWFSLRWAYSEGDRAGVLQKLSRKGWICKTWEGEVAQYVVAGVAPQIWSFSVRSDVVAQQLAAQVGRNVQLHYTEHVGIPTRCFAETPYFVQRFTLMTGLPGTPGSPTQPAIPLSPSAAPQPTPAPAPAAAPAAP